MADQFKFTVETNPNPIAAAERRGFVANPPFGRVTTDHMAVVRWTKERGWHEPRITPYRAFTLDPCAAVLHYGQAIFEGMKAYQTSTGAVNLFRPEANARRFAASARRLAMPEAPIELFVEAVTQLVRIDADWVGTGETSLYLRPFMFADDAFLGIRPALTHVFAVIASPIGDYFGKGAGPLSIWVTSDYTRAAPGGTGAAKCGGNYAAGLSAQQEAALHHCDQVLFLDAVHRRYVEELGGMNIFFGMADGSLITPPLGGTILAGITRDSIIQLCRDRGLVVHERPYTLKEIRDDAQSGSLREIFACGTAAVVQSIGVLKDDAGEIRVPGGDLATSLRRELTSIQKGDTADKHGWVYRVV